MALKWDLYKTRLEITGTTFKERQINDVIDAINDNFEDSPSFYEVSINGSSTLTGVQIVDNSSNDANKVDYIRKIVMKPNDTITVGDIVDWDSKKWIITSAEKFSDVYYYGMMQECNNVLKYYDKNSVSLTIPCIVSKYTNGLNETKYINVLDNEIIVTISHTEITEEISNGALFSIGKKNYEVIDVDYISTVGLLIIKMKVSEQAVPVPQYSLVITNGSSINVGSLQTEQLFVQVLDGGNIITPTPSISYTSSNTGVATVSTTGLITPHSLGTAIITAKLTDNNAIIDTITVNIITENTNLSYTLIGSSAPDTEIVKGITKTYVASKYATGVIVPTAEFVFDIIATNVPTSAYTLTVVNKTTCTIKANSYPYNITLRARDVKTNEVTTKQIALKSPI